MCLCVCAGSRGVVGGLWLKGDGLLFQRAFAGSKQETFLLFWLVVATSVWNFEEENSHVALRSEHACMHAQTQTQRRAYTNILRAAEGNAWHASIGSDAKPPGGCYEELPSN